ncbi:hypothetical protein A7A69_13325 [Acinetobacter sp. Ac_1271]|nr:hypothetical protein [Acinetobacter guerrae]
MFHDFNTSAHATVSQLIVLFIANDLLNVLMAFLDICKMKNRSDLLKQHKYAMLSADLDLIQNPIYRQGE